MELPLKESCNFNSLANMEASYRNAVCTVKCGAYFIGVRPAGSSCWLYQITNILDVSKFYKIFRIASLS